jgi:hypothetical protein
MPPLPVVVNLDILKNNLLSRVSILEMVKVGVFFARPISLFVQSGFCSAPDREFYAL